MYTVLVILHVLVCLVLCLVVLLQSSKGGGLAGAFGGGGGMPQQIFGTRGMTTLLHKLTIYFAVGFFLTSALLFVATGRVEQRPRSVVGEAQREGAFAPEPQAPAAESPLPPPPGTDARSGLGAQPGPPVQSGNEAQQQPQQQPQQQQGGGGS